ncbi:MAG: asparaginyl-tRNA synthetase, partial [Nonlabens sp.]
MKRIAAILKSDPSMVEITVKGWVRSFRNDRFIALNDGSTIHNLQAVIEPENYERALLDQINVAAAVSITGTLVESEGSGQRIELQATKVEVLATADPEEVKKTILSPKKHKLETLREQAHLRVRTNTFGAVMRVRAALSFAVHSYFQKEGFYQAHTPIITGSDAEGAGEMFRI